MIHGARVAFSVWSNVRHALAGSLPVDASFTSRSKHAKTTCLVPTRHFAVYAPVEQARQHPGAVISRLGLAVAIGIAS